jgi:hypothetical protein
MEEYQEIVRRLKAERTEFLKNFPALSSDILAAVGNY